jgi:esterase
LFLQLNFKKYGTAPENLIIIHGFLGSLDNWQTLAIEFSKNFSVYTIDMRNHGKSPHTEHHSIKLMVEDLANFMKLNKINTTHLLGHSMGGKVAMQFAINYPEKIDKLIIVDIAPREYKHGHDSIFEALNAIDLSQITRRKEAEDKMMHLVPDFGTRQFLLKNLTSTASGAYTWKMNLKVLQNDYNEIVAQIEYNGIYLKPVLFIRGSLSLYIKPADEVEIIEHFVNAKIETIGNAGHWLHAEKPKEFYELVVSFLLN